MKRDNLHFGCANPMVTGTIHLNRRVSKMALSKTTQDHDEIRKWAEKRGAVPSEVASTHSKDEPGLLRFSFPRAKRKNDDNLSEISWEDFFEKFDSSNLELVYQEKTASGQQSNFNKLVHPEAKSTSSHKSSATKSRRRAA
jgi:hypothetical protein